LHARILIAPGPWYGSSAYLLLALIPFVASRSPRFGPARLGGATKCLTSFLGSDIPPPRSAEANGLPFYWRRGKFPTRDVEHLQGEIEQDLRRKTSLSHDPSERHRSSDAKARRQFRWNVSACGGIVFRCWHA